MTVLLYFVLAIPIMGITGHHPDVVRNGKCIAEPGTYDALWCPESTWRKTSTRHAP